MSRQRLERQGVKPGAARLRHRASAWCTQRAPSLGCQMSMRPGGSALLSWTSCSQAGRWSCAAGALAAPLMLRSTRPQGML